MALHNINPKKTKAWKKLEDSKNLLIKKKTPFRPKKKPSVEKTTRASWKKTLSVENRTPHQ